MAEVRIQLFNGEQDGYRANIDLRGDIPEVFYVWRASDNEAISSASGKKRMVLADKLAVLAYRLASEEDQNSNSELRYVRDESADKALPAM